MTTSERRRDAVARLVRTRRIGTQEALLAALAREGFRATQATLSRDLTRLGARRVSRPDGAYYEVDGPAAADPLAALRGLVVAVEGNASLVVVRTAAGAASAVARAVDDARLPEVLGTIAGDDTIFVAPAGALRPRALAARLAELLGAPAPRAGAGAH
ncbi:MAG: arginine repressor [Anaeromyxobacter sp.]|nr:arginine repressor [Anaeromyxobacter sp.]MBL0276618.1 arginine repressor [Anaeromyxobacter sp.]